MKMMEKIKNKVINNIVYLLIGLIVILLLYARYLLLVNDGQALSIEELKTTVIEGIVEKYDSINKKDSIILELKTKNEILKEEKTE